MNRKLFIALLFVAMFLFLNKAFAITCDYYISSGGYTISSPGVYCLSQDISGNININSNNVILDGLGHTIYNGKVSVSSNKNNVTIQNLKIQNGRITLASGIKNVTIENVEIYGTGDSESGCFDGYLPDSDSYLRINNLICKNGGFRLKMPTKNIDKSYVIINNSIFYGNFHIYGKLYTPWCAAGVVVVANYYHTSNLYLTIENSYFYNVNNNSIYFLSYVVDQSYIVEGNHYCYAYDHLTINFYLKFENNYVEVPLIYTQLDNSIFKNNIFLNAIIYSNKYIYRDLLGSIYVRTKTYKPLNITFENNTFQENIQDIDNYHIMDGLSETINSVAYLVADSLKFINNKLEINGNISYGLKLNNFNQAKYPIINNTNITVNNNYTIAIYDDAYNTKYYNVKITGGKYGIEFARNTIYNIYNSRICNATYDIYFTSGVANVYDSYFDSVYPDVTKILDYPDNNYWCDGTPRFGPFLISYMPPTPENNATITEREVTIKINTTQPVKYCKLYFNGSVYYMLVDGATRRYAWYTVKGLDDGDYTFYVICENFENVFNTTETRLIHVRIKFHNELHLYGYFDLTQNKTLTIKPEEPYKFTLSNLPFKFDMQKAVITINRVDILPVKVRLNPEEYPQSYYQKYEQTWNQGFGGGQVSFAYQSGIGGSYKYTLGLSVLGGSKFVYLVFFDTQAKQTTFDNEITLSFKMTGNESLTLYKPFVSPERNSRGIIPIILVFVKDLYTDTTKEYVILPTYDALGDLKTVVDEFFSSWKATFIKLSYPLSSQYEFNFSLNGLLNIYGERYKLEKVYIGVLSVIYQPSANLVVFGKDSFKLNIPNILGIRTQALFNDLEVKGTFTVNYLSITAYKPAQTITEPPFPIYINGHKVYTRTVTLTNINSIEITSNSYVVVYANIKVYGTIKVPFEKVNNYTYSAYLRYSYPIPFNLLNVTLYQLPQKPIKILKAEYYLNNSQITWIKVWNETQTQEDITYMFELVDNLTGYTYSIKSEYYTIFFDPTNGAKLQSTRFGDEVYNITYYTQSVPDVSIVDAKLITSYNMPTSIAVTINSTVNVTQNATITLSLTCANHTYITQQTITILNLTQEYTFDISQYISELTGFVECKAVITIKPQIDEIKADNEYVLSFAMNLTKPNLTGNITVTVFDAETNNVIDAFVSLQNMNGTVIAEGQTVNGTIVFANVSYGYYKIIVNATGYYTLTRMFYHGSNNTKIFAYLIPTTINKTEYGVLQVCLYYKDLEPIQDYPVNVYYANGTLYKVIRVNSTGCGSTIVPANKYYIVNTTLPNNETLSYTIYVKPFTQGYTEAILVSKTLTSGNVVPEVAIMYAEILHMEGESNAKYPVVVFLYSSIPQTITLGVTLQKYVNGSWIIVSTKQVNVTFTDYKQTKQEWIVFDIYNVTGFEKYRAVVKIVSYKNDTNLDNNEYITQNITIHIQIDVGVAVIPMTYKLLPSKQFKFMIKTFGNVKLSNTVTITITYFDPLQNKTVKTTKEIIISTGKNVTESIAIPYAPYVNISVNIKPVGYEKVDRNPENNKWTQTFEIGPDVRIEKVEAPKVVQSGGYAHIKVYLISNRVSSIIISINGNNQIYTVNMGHDTYDISYKVPSLAFYEPAKTQTYTITISGDELSDGNSATVTVTVINPTFVSLLVFVLAFVFVLVLIFKVIPRLLTKHMIKDIEFEFVRRKR